MKLSPWPCPWPWCRKVLPDLLSLPAVKEIAEHHNKTAAQVLLRHTVQRGIIVIPKSSKPHRIQQNIDVSRVEQGARQRGSAAFVVGSASAVQAPATNRCLE